MDTSFGVNAKSLFTLESLVKTIKRNGVLALAAALDMGIDIPLKRRVWVQEIQ